MILVFRCHVDMLTNYKLKCTTTLGSHDTLEVDFVGWWEAKTKLDPEFLHLMRNQFNHWAAVNAAYTSLILHQDKGLWRVCLTLSKFIFYDWFLMLIENLLHHWVCLWVKISCWKRETVSEQHSRVQPKWCQTSLKVGKTIVFIQHRLLREAFPCFCAL